MRKPMTKAQFRGAFTAWRLAIENKLDNSSLSLDTLASQFGKSISTPRYLREVRDCFCIKSIELLFEEINGAADS